MKKTKVKFLKHIDSLEKGLSLEQINFALKAVESTAGELTHFQQLKEYEKVLLEM